jgi:hypothetical protein
MGRLFGLVLILAAIWVGMTVYEKGVDEAFGGIFAPLQPLSEREEPEAAEAAEREEAPARRRGTVTLPQHVRERVTSDLQRGAERRGY